MRTMKKVTLSALVSIMLLTGALLALAPNKPAEKIVLNENVGNKTALVVSTTAPTNNSKTNSSLSPTPTNIEKQMSESPHNEQILPIPSSFVVAVLIISLVEVFGLILSLSLRKRGIREKRSA
jgi:hypothetical protein